MTDLELLRTYEPILRFTQGELFFPCGVDGYVRRCSLLPRTQNRVATPIVPAGGLDLAVLVREARVDGSRPLCLRLVEEPLKGAKLRQWQQRRDRPAFHTAGRLARVGLTARFVDSLFSLSLLLRGTVPGGTAAAAEELYSTMFKESPEFVYHGRVLRQDGYIVLNYLFFYFMNDWRSTFAGVNDHEADWEQIFVYLAERHDGKFEPAWLAYASHDYHGDDLRRRWDDPELTTIGTHPVVFPGAGSHSSYFQPGEYLTSVELPHARPVLETVRFARRFWSETLGQGESRLSTQIEGLFRIPFVDYARGDGLSIGPEQEHQWNPVLITDETAWVGEYRGLWGLDTHDPLEGELAPSGPKYQRDGSVRQTWYDPLGWAGLSKVPPPDQAIAVLAERTGELERELEGINGRLSELGSTLPALGLEVLSLAGVSYLAGLHKKRLGDLGTLESERDELRNRCVEIEETLRACRSLMTSLEAGDHGDPEAHLRHKREPQTALEIRQGRVAEVWAGLSVAILLLGGVAGLLFARENWVSALLLIVTAVVVVENALHRTLQRLLLNTTIVLALVSTAVLVYRFFWTLSILAVVTIAVVILRDNLREIRGM